ncbi:MAG: hypothetical protein AAGA54_34265 [Myxococcota bacterium]
MTTRLQNHALIRSLLLALMATASAACDAKDSELDSANAGQGSAAVASSPSAEGCGTALTQEACEELNLAADYCEGSCTWARTVSTAADQCDEDGEAVEEVCVFAAHMEEHQAWLGFCDGESYQGGEDPAGVATLSLFYRETESGVELLEGYPVLLNTFPEDGGGDWEPCQEDIPACSAWCCLEP